MRCLLRTQPPHGPHPAAPRFFRLRIVQPIALANQGETIIALLMLSMLGKFLSRYGFPSAVIDP